MDNWKCWRETSWQSPFSCLTNMTSYAPQKASGLFTIHHGPEELKKKEKEMFDEVMWGWIAAPHISGWSRLICCPAGCLCEDPSTVRTRGLHRRVVPITGFHSPHLSFILSDKNDKHISLFTMRFASFVKSWKKVWLHDNAQTRGGFLSSKQQLMNGFKWKAAVKA